jgi:hypothetical protein
MEKTPKIVIIWYKEESLQTNLLFWNVVYITNTERNGTRLHVCEDAKRFISIPSEIKVNTFVFLAIFCDKILS